MSSLPARLTKLEAAPRMVALPTTTTPLESPADVLALLGETIHDTRAGRCDARTAAVIGSLAAVALKAMEVGDLADQLEALTAVLAPEKRRRLPQGRR